MPRSRNASVTFILFTLLLDMLGIGLIMPVLPRLVTSFVGGDLSAGSRYYGACAAVYAAMQFIFAPIIGGLSDRFGRRAVILSSLLGAGLDYVLLTFAPSLVWLFVGRAIAGITGANFSAATAYIADVTPPERRAQGFGLVGAAIGLGFIVGPALGGLLGSVNLRLPFMVAAVLNLLNFLYGLLVLPESLAPEHRRAFSLRRANSFSSLANLRRYPLVLGLAGMLVCTALAQHMFYGIWALHGEARFGWSEREVGASFAVIGVAGALVQGVLVSAVIPPLGERRALVLGLAIGVLGFAAYGAATRGWMMYALIVPASVASVAGPATQAIISRAVGPSEQGEVQGSLMSLGSVMAILGPLIGSDLFARFSAPDASPRIPGAPFFLAALLNALGLLLVLRLFARRPEAVTTQMSAQP